MQSSPLSVQIIRGTAVESTHYGKLAIVSADNTTILEKGDTSTPIYPRSSIKAFQALPTIESQAHKAFNFTEQEIAIMCASHNGEPQHTQTVRTMLEKMNLSETDLECGSHWPMREQTAYDLAAQNRTPSPLHNNCSGKHAGMLAYCKHNNIDHKGYTEANHPMQIKIRETIEYMCDTNLKSAPCERDGCSVPTWSFPLRAIAYGFARFASPESLQCEKMQACKTLYKAVTENPFMIAGSDRYCTIATIACDGNLFLKVGAEGVYIGAIPKANLGIALKCDDGAVRGAEAMMSAVLRYIYKHYPQLTHSNSQNAPQEKSEKSKKTSCLRKESGKVVFTEDLVMKNFNGYEIGKIHGIDFES